MADISVRKRGEKWYYSFETASVDGKRKRIERVGGKTKKEALEKGIQALNEYNNAGQHFEPSTVSVADWMDYFVENYSKLNNKYNTVRNHMKNVDTYVKPYFGHYRLAQLSTSTIQEFINEKYINCVARSTVENAISPLSQAYEFAIAMGVVKDNPCKRIKYPKDFARGKERGIITFEQYEKIMEELKDKRTFYMAIMIGWYTGFRISETYGLTWEDIDFEKRTITINKQVVKRSMGVDRRKALKEKGMKEEKGGWYFQTPKTKTSLRTIVVSDVLIAELRKWKKEQLENKLRYGEYYNEIYLKPEKDEKGKEIFRFVDVEKYVQCPLSTADLIFRNENGTYSSTDSFKYASRIIHHRLGFNAFDYHSLRHTHATMLIEAGASPKSVQTRLGHVSIQTTYDRYVHDTDEMKQDAVAVFDDAMAKKQG